MRCLILCLIRLRCYMKKKQTKKQKKTYSIYLKYPNTLTHSHTSKIWTSLSVDVSIYCWVHGNSVDTDQSMRSVAFDLGLHCLLWSVRILGVKSVQLKRGMCKGSDTPRLSQIMNVWYVWKLLRGSMYLWASTWQNIPSDLCAQQSLKTNCVPRWPDQSLRCTHEETFHPRLSKMRLMMILIRLRESTGWFESSLSLNVQR